MLDRRFSSAKYHLFLASRLLVKPEIPPFLNSREADSWARDLIDVYWDLTKAEELFRTAAADITALADEDLSRDRIRTQPFTEQVLSHYRSNVRVGA